MRIRRSGTLWAAALAGLVLGAAVVVRNRPAGGSLLPGPARRLADVEAKLRVVLPEVRFRAAPLDRALDELRRRTGARFVVDWEALADAGVARDEPVDLCLSRVTLDEALKSVLGYVGAGGGGTRAEYTLFDGAVVVTTQAHLGRYVYAAVYDLRDMETGPPPGFDPTMQMTSPATRSNLCFFSTYQRRDVPARVEADESLTSLIQETVAPDSWYDGGGGKGSAPAVATGGTVHAFGGRVVAVTTWQNHRQIEALLAQMRTPPR